MLTLFDPQPLVADVPVRLGDPFSTEPPHPLARRAAESLQARVGAFVRSEGKMFGVLVAAEPSGRVGYLSAFSGMLDGRWQVEGFAPPLFDPAARAEFWPAYEREWRAFEVQLSELAEGPEALALQARARELADRHAAAMSALRERHTENRSRRRLERERLDGSSEETRRSALDALGKQSGADEMEQRRLAAEHRAERASLASAQHALRERVVALEKTRTERSREAWRRIAEGYRLPNARGEERTVAELYAPELPPGGAADCAAPKLLAHAYRLGLRPLALAEFWWGAPSSAGHTAGTYYPACQSKCGRVLPWMLEGLSARKLALTCSK